MNNISIGIDVGTSCVKLVFWDNDYEKYLYIEEGNLRFCQTYLRTIEKYPKHPAILSKKTELKIRFNDYCRSFGQPEEYKHEFIAFLALVIEKAINSFLEKNHVYKYHETRWTINLGMPTDLNQYYDIRKEYLNSLKIAFCIFHYKIKLKRKNLLLLINNNRLTELIKELKSKQRFYFNVYPEIIATCNNYSNSLEIPQQGLICIIDIGAWTLDIAFLYLDQTENGQRIEVWHTKVLEQLGVNSLARKYNIDLENIENENKLHKSALNNIKNEVAEELKKEFLYLVKIVAPNNNKDWEDGVISILLGGGSKISFYREAIHDSNLIIQRESKDYFKIKTRGYIFTNNTISDSNIIQGVAKGLCLDFDESFLRYATKL